jgi:flagellar basal-body rod protein FlgB
MPDLSTSNMLGTYEKYLDLTATRQSLVIANMANVDTPNYHTKDIDFRSELHRAIDTGTGSTTPVVRSVAGLLERPDGNNVSLEREGMLLSETQMQYRLGIQLIRGTFNHWLSAINEGK